MTMPIPRWATNTNYSTGPDTGTPTKVDPSSAANGFIAGVVAAPQHVNYKLSEIIEYVNGLSQNKDQFAEIDEDFLPGEYDSAAGLIHAKYVWKVAEYVAGVVDPSAASLANPGQFRSDIATTEGSVVRMGAEFGDAIIRWEDVAEVLLVAAVTSTALTSDEMFVGLAEQITFNPALPGLVLGDDAVGLWFRRATSANWMVRHKVGGVDDATVSAVPVVSTEFVVLKMRRVSSTSTQIYLNGTLVATLTDGSTAPGAFSQLALGMVGYAGGGDTLTVLWDKVYVKWATPDRQS